MRKFFLILFLSWLPLAQAQSETQAVASFKRMVEVASKEISFTSVFMNDASKGWRKSYVQIGNITYDIKKTDSAINPLVGYVSFVARQKASPPYSSKEMASKATEVVDAEIVMDFSITYHLDGKRWRAVKAVFDSSLRGVGISRHSPTRGVVYEPTLRKEKSALDKALDRWMP